MQKIQRITASHPNLNQIVTELQTNQGETEEFNAELESVKKFLEDDKNYLLLAYEGSEVAGMMIAYDLLKIDNRKKEFLLYEIEVKKKFRQKGVGKAMIQELVRIAKSEGAHEIWVLTDKENTAANQLYSKSHQPNTHEDAVMYVYDLK